MRVGVLGTGRVGRTIASRLVSLDHEVMMGSRRAGNENAVAWAAEAGPGGGEGSFADAAGHGEVLVNATAGTASVEALEAAGERNLAGKVLVDVANPLDGSAGMPPVLSVCNTDSLAERIQARFPAARVVKALNTVNSDVMVHPEVVPGNHCTFICGNDAGAKEVVRGVLRSFGWPDACILDLGDITAARGPEMYLPLWLRLMIAGGTAHFNINVVRRLDG